MVDIYNSSQFACSFQLDLYGVKIHEVTIY